MITAIIVIIGVLAIIALAAASASVRVLREYERGVVFRLGRLMDQRGPGLILLIPTIDRMVRIHLRTVTLAIPAQEVITRDNVPVRVTAVAYYRVVDPNSAVTQVENFHSATTQISQTTLRSVLGGADLDTLLSERERLNEDLQHVIDAQTEPWGIKVTTVEIKDVEIPERMQHAIARQAEAERERRAKIINAEGEFQAAGKLAQAADVIGENPVTLQLRYLQTLREIGGNQNSTIVFPMPIDLVKPMLEAVSPPASAPRPRVEIDKGTADDNGHRLESGAASPELGAGPSGELPQRTVGNDTDTLEKVTDPPTGNVS
ncbi:MAG TPA: slipin family protein [Solirubrobacteraceae bacterium]|nr:slipin family protein [Solirubrobacteraceae bacterium]